MSIYNNIKLTSPPIRVGDNPDLVPPLDSGSLEQVATMAPIMGSFRGILKNNVGETYISFRITPPRATSTIAGPPSYPYNTLHIKGIALKEQAPFITTGTVTTGFEYWAAITNPYWPLVSINFPLTSPDGNSSFNENLAIFPATGANNLHPTPFSNPTFFNNSPIQSIEAFWEPNSIRFVFQTNSTREDSEPFFVKGQYLLL